MPPQRSVKRSVMDVRPPRQVGTTTSSRTATVHEAPTQGFPESTLSMSGKPDITPLETKQDTSDRRQKEQAASTSVTAQQSTNTFPTVTIVITIIIMLSLAALTLAVYYKS